MVKEYSSILSTPTEADNIGHFSQYIGENPNIGQIYLPGRYIGLSLVVVIILWIWIKNMFWNYYFYSQQSTYLVFAGI